MGSDPEDNDDFLPDWFRPRQRRRGSSQGGFFGMDRWFPDFDDIFERMFQDMARGIPKEFMTEKKLPDGSTVKQYGPFVYGYSMSVGPDGKPTIQEFGNVKPSKRQGHFGLPRPALEPSDSREPLVDVIDENDKIRVIAELPGVEKGDIKTTVNEDSMTISVDNEANKYYKEIKLPTHVNSETSKASYNNGVLEITFVKTRPKLKGKELKID
jgi:HSP20 family protein